MELDRQITMLSEKNQNLVATSQSLKATLEERIKEAEEAAKGVEIRNNQLAKVTIIKCAPDKDPTADI